MTFFFGGGLSLAWILSSFRVATVFVFQSEALVHCQEYYSTQYRFVQIFVDGLFPASHTYMHID